MARRLIATVVVRDPSTFGPRVFGPGDDVPEWAAALITNPMVWADGGDAQPTPSGDEGGASVPPTSGKGSGRDAWAAYAAAYEVDVEKDMSRDDIIAACELAGVRIA